MNIILIVHTPAQVHLWSNVIRLLKEHGHIVEIIARDYQTVATLLRQYGYHYSIYGKAATTKAVVIIKLPFQLFKIARLVIKKKPDLLLGPGIIEAYISGLIRKPLIAFWDSEAVSKLETKQEELFMQAIITPSGFKADLGKKHIKIPSYKELAYLHPNHFSPNPSVFNELKLSPGDKYVILRFNAFDAVHDINRKGFSLEDKYGLVDELEPFARVFISSETPLPKALKPYELPAGVNHIHHVLCYAHLLVTDTQTIATEAAVLGVPTVRCNNFVGPNDMSNFIELEKKYGLIFSYNRADVAINKASELVKRNDIKAEWAEKRKKLLADKIDLTDFMIDFIERWPQSMEEQLEKKAQV